MKNLLLISEKENDMARFEKLYFSAFPLYVEESPVILCFHIKKFWKLMGLKKRHLITSEIYMEYLNMKEYLGELIL